MTERFDPYRVLGVSRNADTTTIRNAFRKLALEYHPDRNPDSEDAEERFKTVAAAYEILMDPALRERWNRRAEGATRGGGFPNAPFGFSQGPFRGPAAGPQRRRHRTRPGHDVTLRIELTPEEARNGRPVTIDYTVRRPCHRCSGRGGGGRMRTCPTCLGWGRVRPPPGKSFGRDGFDMDCPDCSGTAYVYLTPCPACGGDGLMTVEREVEIRVPAGVEDGKTLNRQGAGHAGPRGGPPGRLRVTVVVAGGDSGG